jgi:putative SOS response-associated peptidase YedK
VHDGEHTRYNYAVCGRFTLTIPTYDDLANALGVEVMPGAAELYRPRYNVAPTDPSWIVRFDAQGHRELALLSWGLVPRWSKTLTQAGRPINARAETLETKPVFKDSFARRRCVVVSDGFFEWDKSPKRLEAEGQPQPLWFRPESGGLLLMAGVWDSWRTDGGERRVQTFSIVTTAAGPDVEGVHDRMPLVLAGADVDRWLTVPPKDAPAVVTDEVRALIRPAAKGTLVATPVSRRVGNVKNDDPSVLSVDPPPNADNRGQTLSLFSDLDRPSRRLKH